MDNTFEYKYYNWGPLLFKTNITPEECQQLLEEGKKCRKKINDHRARLAGHLKEEYYILVFIFVILNLNSNCDWELWGKNIIYFTFFFIM